MAYKKLISPEFRIGTAKFEITSGMDVEVFSSREAKADWCKVELTQEYKDIISYDDMERATVELGYDNDYDTLLSGFCRKTSNDYWKEIMIKDAMIKVERVVIKQTFVDCTPQDIIKYILLQAGITDYQLSDMDYGKRNIFVLGGDNGVKAITQINNVWGLQNDFFFQDNVFYWGCKPKQKNIYVLEEDVNILSFEKIGEMFEIETLGVPWIHHSQEVEVEHSKFTGTVLVEKTIVKTDEKGLTQMFIYFKGA